jgi:hypothetical protein
MGSTGEGRGPENSASICSLHGKMGWRQLALNNVNSIQASPKSPRGGRDPFRRPGFVRLLSHGWRQGRRLFHLLVGITFLVLAAAGAAQSFSEWRAYAETPSNGMWRFNLLAGFTLLLLIFGLYSFVKARSVR